MVTAAEVLRRRKVPLRLVIFDCDGVLVDSEMLSSEVVAAELSRLGWQMDAASANRLFVGMTFADMVPVLERKLGRPLPPDWVKTVKGRLVAVLGERAEAMPGALAALTAVHALGLGWRIASNSSHEEMAAKFGRLGIGSLVAGRIHSAQEVTRGKPAPDLFLAAARAEGVAPEACVVIEDSLPGAQAAAAAGMDCLGFVPTGDGAALAAAGAGLFRSLFELPALLRRQEQHA
jgi:HAD superfamily hydrolase (TIGR01509 family)